MAKKPSVRKTVIRRPGGRKRIKASLEILRRPINMNEVISLIELQCTGEEIASNFRVCYDTLNRRIQEEFSCSFSELKKVCDGPAKISLRRYQFQQAEKNATMAIWLGKQWLGQKENTELTVSAETTKHFDDVLDQLRTMQYQRKDADGTE